MVNVDVIGRLGADAEILNGKKGEFVKFRFATDDFKNSEKITTWFNVIFSGERALKIAQYLKKGTALFIRGNETVGTYTDRNGNVQVSREIKAVDVDFINLGNSGQTQTETSTEGTTEVSTGKLVPPTPTAAPKVTAKVEAAAEEDETDDLPF